MIATLATAGALAGTAGWAAAVGAIWTRLSRRADLADQQADQA